MAQLEADLQTKFNMVMEEYNSRGEYTLPTSNRKIEMFNLNSLIYIEFGNFVAILEEILNIRLEPSMANYIHSKLYVENISHFVPSVSKAVCSNFVDGRTFAEIRSFALEHGCKPLHSEAKERDASRDMFGIGDNDLYRSILYDEDFLLKQLHCQSANEYNRAAEEELQSPILLNDPYAQINELKHQTHFTASEFKNINRNDIFRGNPYISEMANKEVKHMYPFDYASIFIKDDDFKERSHIIRNDSLKKPQGYSGQQSKPRGKQMEFIGDELSERPFICKFPNCNRAFKRFEHLKRHNKMHTGEKPYKCKYPGCPREFSRSDNLTAHYKTHNITNRSDIPMEYNTKASNFGNY